MAWKSISKDKYLYTRDGRFYVRRRVPAELREAVGREFLIASLNTSDFKEASRIANRILADHQKLLDEAGGRLYPPENSRKLDDLSADEIEKIVVDWFSNNYVAQANQFSGGDLVEPDPDEIPTKEDLHFRKQRLAKDLQWLMVPKHSSHEAILRPTIQAIAQRNGLAVRRASKVAMDKRIEIVANTKGWKYDFFFDLVRRAAAELFKQEIDQINLAGTYISDADLKEAMHSPRRRGKRTVTLAELIEEFKADPNRKDMRKKVEADYALLFRVMDEVIGYDRRLRDIERDDCKAVRDLLLRLPANSTKLYRGMSFAEAADQGSKDGRKILSPVTVNSYIHKMSALFNYAVVEERTDKNPARKLGLEGHEHGEDDRHPFTSAQLEKIFSAPIYSGCQDDERNWAKIGENRPKRTKFWVPLIGLYQGMRLNEICQLRIEDVQHESGIAFFNIRPDIVRGKSKTVQADDEGGRRTKTASARRRVPVHPMLQELGFLEFVNVLREAGSNRLFPDLKKDGRGYFSDGFQKWFSRFLEKQGAKEEKTSFHSFRHNWADAMRLAEVSQERLRLIGGWKRTATDEKYGSYLPLEEIYMELCKIQYSAIGAIAALR